jgi:protein-S-isoprenylcysteine O-methyltransferase Ste14
MALRVPRWVGLVVWPVLLGAVHVGVPVGLARSGRRRGWHDDGWRPGALNLVGVGPLCAGCALVSWSLARHYTNAPGRAWEINRKLEPEYLLTDGPYRLSRNPMHLGGIGIWSGWTIWFGSAPVAVGSLVLTSAFRAGIAWEEQVLERRWGEEWRTYATRTPRWLSFASARSSLHERTRVSGRLGECLDGPRPRPAARRSPGRWWTSNHTCP